MIWTDRPHYIYVVSGHLDHVIESFYLNRFPFMKEISSTPKQHNTKIPANALKPEDQK